MKQGIRKHGVGCKSLSKKKVKKVKKSYKKVLTMQNGCGTIYTLIREVQRVH